MSWPHVLHPQTEETRYKAHVCLWWKYDKDDTERYSSDFSDRWKYEKDDKGKQLYNDMERWLNSGDVFKIRDDADRIRPQIPKNGEIFEGDMVMDQRLRDAILGGDRKRSAVADDSYLWPKGIVPYELDDSVSSEIRDDIEKAIKDMAEYTCVRFVKRHGEHDYVLFRSIYRRCSSPVGRRGGRQNITVGEGCTREGTILHEMMHAIGIIHEQSRPDRDKHVIIIKENVKKRYLHNFKKYGFGIIRNLDTPYNYASIMHYRNNAFSKNGKPTLIARGNPSLKFGQRKFFSQGDVHQINTLYQCDNQETTNNIYQAVPVTHDNFRLVEDHYQL